MVKPIPEKKTRTELRREKEKERKRNEIIEAAIKLFKENGIDNTTMQEVAEEALFSKSTLYHYFENKEELRLAVTAQIYKRSLRLYEKAFEGSNLTKSAKDRIREFNKIYTRFYNKGNKHFAELIEISKKKNSYRIIMEKIENNKPLKRSELEYKTELEKTRGYIASIIGEELKKHKIKTDVSQNTMAMLISSIYGGLLNEISNMSEFERNLYNLDIEESLNLVMKWIIKGLLTS
ncbi:MAG: helix-turn-helix transcriptional regulator [archaeon]|nr:helix-turn-helix transcriptional regulator [archaeon]